MNTPWGKAQQIAEFDKGILWVDTASHGGYLVPKDVVSTMPQPIQDYIATSIYGGPWGNYMAFEEDCEAALVDYCFTPLAPKNLVYGTIWQFYPEIAKQLGIPRVSQ